MERKLRAWEIAALTAICAALLIGTWAQGRQSSLSAGLVRLHVIAVSDDEYEQALKLRVRDAVLEYLSPRLDGVGSSEDAKAVIRSNMDGIAKAAESASEGRAVTVTLSREKYPTRQYEGFALPAGEYDSLRVILGEGKGHNWWCVVFPPICLSAAQAERVRDCMSQEDFALISEESGYEIRFRIVELWGSLISALS